MTHSCLVWIHQSLNFSRSLNSRALLGPVEHTAKYAVFLRLLRYIWKRLFQLSWGTVGNMKGLKLFYNTRPLVSVRGVLFIRRWDVKSRTLPRRNTLEGDETSHLRALTGPLKDNTVQQRIARSQQGCVPALLGWRCLWGRGAARARPFLQGSSALSGRAWAERRCVASNHSSDLGWKT